MKSQHNSRCQAKKWLCSPWLPKQEMTNLKDCSDFQCLAEQQIHRIKQSVLQQSKHLWLQQIIIIQVLNKTQLSTSISLVSAAMKVHHLEIILFRVGLGLFTKNNAVVMHWQYSNAKQSFSCCTLLKTWKETRTKYKCWQIYNKEQCQKPSDINNILS